MPVRKTVSGPGIATAALKTMVANPVATFGAIVMTTTAIAIATNALALHDDYILPSQDACEERILPKILKIPPPKGTPRDIHRRREQNMRTFLSCLCTQYRTNLPHNTPIECCC